MYFDELSSSDIEKINQYLLNCATQSAIEGLYWVEITDDLLDEQQCGHQECKPYRFAVELHEDAVHLEMLIRSANTMRCDCIKFATPLQQNFIMRFGNTLIEACDIRA